MQGLSTSLPEDAEGLGSISTDSLGNAEMMRTGYAIIRYDYASPVAGNLGNQEISGLFTAGQDEWDFWL